MDLRQTACRVRAKALRAITRAGSGHPGGSLSCADLLVFLYFEWMKPVDEFILSKGHAAPALYAVLAEKGVIKEKELEGLRKPWSRLQGHPNRKTLPLLPVSTGSLGHGLAVGTGIALAKKLDKSPARVFVMLGDGELDEGEVWEALALAGHKNLDNLIAVVDRNNLQLDGRTEEILSLEPLKEKISSFKWAVTECDGHDFESIRRAFSEPHPGRPLCVIARTVKGKGVSFMEGNPAYHGKPLTEEELERALDEIRLC